MIRVVFLGTSGSVPTNQRNLPAIALRRNKEILLFDCAEGTQRQMLKAGLSISRVSRIFISHLHGDHVMGLPGIIQTLSLMERETPLHVYGPSNLSGFIDSLVEHLEFAASFEICVHSAHPGIIFESSDYLVKCERVDHGLVEAYAYAFEEKPRPGKFHPEKAITLGVPIGPLWKQLQLGKSVSLKDGRVVYPEEVVEPPKLGRKIVYSGDTAPCQSLLRMSSFADVLIHESTFDQSLEGKAIETKHSTSTQAALVAREANVKLLVLTHISSRYTDPNVLLQQAKEIFANTIIAQDFTEVLIDLEGCIKIISP
ncbi:MAG: ribonuclease Z [Candidatus Jordarchaeales archaeon]|nr:ribonuclease Z [Candidatus Jordarchaeia archaeon]